MKVKLLANEAKKSILEYCKTTKNSLKKIVQKKNQIKTHHNSQQFCQFVHQLLLLDLNYQIPA